MTKQTTNNDVLLSLWALEQHFKQNEPEHDQITFLYSGGQDSSTLAWFLYHTEPIEQSGLRLVHCTHLMQQDSFFMAQHAVNLSFWLGWHHTTFFPTQALLSEKQASCWRASMLDQVGAGIPPRITANGHTETDKRESDFFQFARTPENASDTVSVSRRPSTEYWTENKLRAGRTEAYPETRGNGYVRAINPFIQNVQQVHFKYQSMSSRITGNSVMGQTLRRPLMLLERKDTRTITAGQRLPVYPDQTNFECRTTRTQIRYLVFPLLAKLGFGFFE